MTVPDDEGFELTENVKKKDAGHKAAIRGKPQKESINPMVEAILAIYKVSAVGGMQRSH